MTRLSYLEEMHFQFIVEDILHDHECTTEKDFEDMRDLLSQLVEITIDEYIEELKEDECTCTRK